MDGLKPAARVARSTNLRSSPGSINPVVPTELPASRTVTAVADGAPQERYHQPHDGGAAQHAQSGHDCIIDAEGRQVIYSAVDVRSDAGGQTGTEETARKLRAYNSSSTERSGTVNKALEKTA